MIYNSTYVDKWNNFDDLLDKYLKKEEIGLGKMRVKVGDVMGAV